MHIRRTCVAPDCSAREIVMSIRCAATFFAVAVAGVREGTGASAPGGWARARSIVRDIYSS